MKRLNPDYLLYYDKHISMMIARKCQCSLMDALRKFVSSETHALLEQKEAGLMCFSELGIFDMWEAEQQTGDPRNSEYIRSL